MLEDLKLGMRLVAVIIVVGFFIGFGSGLIENTSGPANVPGDKYYGFPLAWRAVNTVTGSRYEYPVELFVDCLFGVLFVSIIAGAAIITENRLMKKSRKKVK